MEIKTRKRNRTLKIIEFSIIALTIIFVILLGVSIIPNLNTNVGILKAIGITSNNTKAPGDFVSENQIEVYGDKIIIRIPNAILSKYAPTGSMKPILDYNANGIEIPVTSTEQIEVGDIIAYTPLNTENEYIVHRVIEIGEDELGWYCIPKGDNNNATDGKIRFEQIKFITIAIIY